jgi:hypothetical protein
MSLSHPINPSENRLARPRGAPGKAMLAVCVAVAVSSSLPAQTSSPPPPSPKPPQCSSDPERHRFDFWLGQWEVTTEGGTVVGSSVIQSVSKGCALLENWTGAKGGQGKSLNAYNPLIHQWQQFWIGADGGVNEYRSSKVEGQSLVFLMEDSSNPSSIVRLTFTPLDSATVRQHSESSADGGRTWVTQYDFYYHRKSG